MSDEKEESLPPFEYRPMPPRPTPFKSPFSEPPLRTLTELEGQHRQVIEQLKADPHNVTLIEKERSLRAERLSRLGEDLR